MRNYIQKGDTLDLVAPAALASGAGALIGTIFGIASTTVASGDTAAFAIVGVFELPKATGAISAGAKVYWDNTAKNVTTTSSGNTLIGAAVAAALSGDAVVRVRLNGTVV